MKRSLAVALLALSVVASGSAQHTTTVGPKPTSPTQDWGLRWLRYYVYQSFTVPTNLKNGNSFRFNFWFDGSPMGNSLYLVNTFMYASHPGFEEVIDSGGLNQDDHGWQSWFISNANIRSGQVLYFLLSSDLTPEYDEACAAAGECPDIQEASTRVTNGNAYAGGDFYNFGELTEQDLLFQAQFTTTPEPATMVLLGSGLAGIAAVALRKRRNDRRASKMP